MNPPVDNIDLLQNLEFVVIQVWRTNPDMPDSAVLRAYEASFQWFKDELRGHTPKPPSLRGLEVDTYAAVKAMCDARLGRFRSEPSGPGDVAPVEVSEVVDALRKLIKSVERHGRTGGRQGYLRFISQFIG